MMYQAHNNNNVMHGTIAAAITSTAAAVLTLFVANGQCDFTTRFGLRCKSWVLWFYQKQLEQEFLVLLPPSTEKNQGESSSGSEDNKPSASPAAAASTPESKWSLLMIFPGGSLYARDYRDMARAVQVQHENLMACLLEEQKEQAPNDNSTIEMQQQQAYPQLVVAIGMDIRFLPRLVKWATNQGDPRIIANLIQAKAERFVLKEQQKTTATEGHQQQTPASIRIEDMYNVHLPSKVFSDMFLWGHSLGGLYAIRAAYPSKFRALILYGCSMSLALSSPDPQQRVIPDKKRHIPPKDLLKSYPKPVLTLMGERDGNLRCYKVAEEARALHDTIGENLLPCSYASRQEDLKRAMRLKKPIIVLPELNHMQMAMDVLPPEAVDTGRADFTSRESLPHAHTTLASVVVDFMYVHSSVTKATAPPPPTPKTTIKTTPILPQTPPRTTSPPPIEPSPSSPRSRSSSISPSSPEDRLLRLGKLSRTIYLEPFLRLLDPVYQSRFIADIQRQLLHVTLSSTQNFHFYEEEDPMEESTHQEPTTPDIVPHWHAHLYDFLYSRPQFDPIRNQIFMEVLEEDEYGSAIAVSVVPQISKTLAFKGRSQEEIVVLSNGKYQELKDGDPENKPPTLMELNQQTFDRVLHHFVTPQQQRRYLKEGAKLRFGPDIEILPAPRWVTTPIAITKSSLCARADAFYLFQSTYTTTPMSMPAPFGGAWYGKPLSPAQAYEWIVFDAFKPF